MSKPCLASIRWNCFTTSPSMPPRMASRYSTTVTLEPSRAQTEPSSSPITPPPTTTRWPGALSNESAPVDDTITFSSMSTLTPGMPETSEPVAMTMFFASTSSTLPSSPVTETLPPESTLPAPFSQSILFFLNRKATPLTFDATVASLCAIIFLRLSLGVTSTPSSSKPWPASANISEAWSRAFDGMQPMLRQVPPSVAFFSTTAVFRPSCAALMAQTYPPGPDPITTTS